MKKIVISVLIIVGLVSAMIFIPKCSAVYSFRKALNQIKNQDTYVSIEKSYNFNDKIFYIYGVNFIGNDYKSPEIIFTTNWQNTTLEWIMPSVSGGGGSMTYGGKIWRESVTALTETYDEIIINIIFTNNVLHKEQHQIKINLK